METGGISRRLVALALALVGHFRGGLARVTGGGGNACSGDFGLHHRRCGRPRRAPAPGHGLPHSRYQFCQAHYLRNLAEPLAEADAAFKGELRKTVRQQVGDVIRQEPRTAPGHAGVLTVTGLLPSPLEKPTAPASQQPNASGHPHSARVRSR